MENMHKLISPILVALTLWSGIAARELPVGNETLQHFIHFCQFSRGHPDLFRFNDGKFSGCGSAPESEGNQNLQNTFLHILHG